MSRKYVATANDDLATASSIFRAFERHRDELTNLASFLMGSRELADVCLIDAYDLCIENGNRRKESLDRKVRRAILQSALEMQTSRLADLRPVYSKRSCPHGKHASLAPHLLTVLTSQVPQVSLRLDVMCRFALVLRGYQEYRPDESATVLGVTGDALDAAYCRGLGALSEFADELFGLCDDAGPELCN